MDIRLLKHDIIGLDFDLRRNSDIRLDSVNWIVDMTANSGGEKSAYD